MGVVSPFCSALGSRLKMPSASSFTVAPENDIPSSMRKSTPVKCCHSLKMSLLVVGERAAASRGCGTCAQLSQRTPRPLYPGANPLPHSLVSLWLGVGAEEAQEEKKRQRAPCLSSTPYFSRPRSSHAAVPPSMNFCVQQQHQQQSIRNS